MPRHVACKLQPRKVISQDSFRCTWLPRKPIQLCDGPRGYRPGHHPCDRGCRVMETSSRISEGSLGDLWPGGSPRKQIVWQSEGGSCTGDPRMVETAFCICSSAQCRNHYDFQRELIFFCSMEARGKTLCFEHEVTSISFVLNAWSVDGGCVLESVDTL